MGDGAKLEDSNVALVGSDADHALRKEAAETEEAWKGCGLEPGVDVWRIEKFKVVPWPHTEYGSFYKGDSYIVLKTFKSPDSDKLYHHIHFWLGSKTTVDEKGTAAYKTVELDDYFDGEPVQYRETEGHESHAFHQMFPHMVYLEGGIDSGFHHVGEDGYIARLLEVRKTKEGVKISHLPLSRDSMSEQDCFLLDAGTKIFKWFGSTSSPFEKSAASMEAENMENRRNGKAKALDWSEEPEEFWRLLGGEGPISAERSQAGTDLPVGEGILHKLSNEEGTLIFAEVARGDLNADMLSSKDTFILDTMSALHVWVGKEASRAERSEAMPMALKYLEKNDRPLHTPIKLIKEGHENDPEWKKIFA
mmetsp:Transcript_90697/g.174040  ORF Transcript_90697/g.174040 Transcript_90697/m.174040 type:complete len:363 (-) Transcript_90697:152-1240(-)